MQIYYNIILSIFLFFLILASIFRKLITFLAFPRFANLSLLLMAKSIKLSTILILFVLLLGAILQVYIFILISLHQYLY